jgi:hypothetical protein
MLTKPESGSSKALMELLKMAFGEQQQQQQQQQSTNAVSTISTVLLDRLVLETRIRLLLIHWLSIQTVESYTVATCTSVVESKKRTIDSSCKFF